MTALIQEMVASYTLMWLGDSNRGKAFNFVNPSRDLAFDIALNEGVCANSCSKVPFPFRSDGHTRPLEECCCFLEVAVLDYEPGLGGSRVVAIIRANFGDAIPPSLETSKVSSGCGIISTLLERSCKILHDSDARISHILVSIWPDFGTFPTRFLPWILLDPTRS